MNKKLNLTVAFCLLIPTLFAQQTVGVFSYDPDAYEAYTLFAPLSGTTTYLIDNCGREVHSWTSSYKPGNSVYLLEDGSLLKTGTITSSTFTGGGGIGGNVEQIDWNGTVLWSYDLATSSGHQHHDIEYLPNGNVLILAWEYKTATQATDAGRNPSLLADSELWPERIVEIQPSGTSGGTIVWEWYLWDHLVQDYDNSKANYGVVTDHPELVNLNFTGSGPGATGGDWIHLNSIDYNPVLDQIIVSSRNLNEIWIIDHSTTTAEAASHSGGNSGKGGDLLYRWGNPQTYDRGSSGDQMLYGQHDAQWIADSLPGAGDIMIYNNGQGRSSGNYSTVDVISPPVDSSGNYTLTTGSPFDPSSLTWTYEAPTATDFYSSFISGASRLENGNTIICEGATGRFFEVKSDGTIVWEYVNPVTNSGIVSQGDPVTQNNVFRSPKYAIDYPAFDGRTLTPGDPIEGDPLPLPSGCDGVFVDASSDPNALVVYPNPANDRLTIELDQDSNSPTSASLFNTNGILVAKAVFNKSYTFSVESLPAGLYICHIENQEARITRKIIISR